MKGKHMCAMTWLPKSTLREMIPQMHTLELQSSIATVSKLCRVPKTVLTPIRDMWTNYNRVLARYGLNILKELEERGYLSKELQTLRELLMDKIIGVPNFEKPLWWTEELCANHRGVMKYLDIRRTLATRIKKHVGDIEPWLKSRNFFEPLPKLSADEVARANELLDKERAPERRQFYSHFHEEPISELIWPQQSLPNSSPSCKSTNQLSISSEESICTKQNE